MKIQQSAYHFAVTISVLALLLAPVSFSAAQRPDNKRLADFLAKHQGRHQRVCDVAGKDDTASCDARVTVDSQGSPITNALPVGYGPTQFRGAYNLTNANSIQTIAIVDAYDDPNIKADLDKYDQTFGLPAFPACTSKITTSCFMKVDQRGGTRYPKANAGWALEIALDVEVAHGLCPTCKLILAEADSNSFANLLAAEDRAVALGANVISNSWGAGEFSAETGATYDGHFNKPGVAITFSSGDGGFGVEYPAASQYVTAVGGTSLAVDANNAYLGETAWSGAGSGCSAYEAQPAVQKALGLTGCGKRMVADVSADADPNTGAAVYDTVRYAGRSGWFEVGGTSLASPIVAAVYALANNPAGLNSAYPYAYTASLNDVTSGSNGKCSPAYLCTSVAGFDGPTGLGTPNGVGGF
jgi:subtilase family serine protease